MMPHLADTGRRPGLQMLRGAARPVQTPHAARALVVLQCNHDDCAIPCCAVGCLHCAANMPAASGTYQKQHRVFRWKVNNIQTAPEYVYWRSALPCPAHRAVGTAIEHTSQMNCIQLHTCNSDMQPGCIAFHLPPTVRLQGLLYTMAGKLHGLDSHVASRCKPIGPRRAAHTHALTHHAARHACSQRAPAVTSAAPVAAAKATRCGRFLVRVANPMTDNAPAATSTPSRSYICTSVTASSLDAFLEEIREAIATGVDIVELRLDFLKDFDPTKDLDRIMAACSIPYIVTYRPTWEGCVPGRPPAAAGPTWAAGAAGTAAAAATGTAAAAGAGAAGAGAAGTRAGAA